MGQGYIRPVITFAEQHSFLEFLRDTLKKALSPLKVTAQKIRDRSRLRAHLNKAFHTACKDIKHEMRNYRQQSCPRHAPLQGHYESGIHNTETVARLMQTLPEIDLYNLRGLRKLVNTCKKNEIDLRIEFGSAVSHSCIIVQIIPNATERFRGVNMMYHPMD